MQDDDRERKEWLIWNMTEAVQRMGQSIGQSFPEGHSPFYDIYQKLDVEKQIKRQRSREAMLRKRREMLTGGRQRLSRSKHSTPKRKRQFNRRKR